MGLRIYIIDTRDSIAQSLAIFFEDLGHEVSTADELDGCPHFCSEGPCCHRHLLCADVFIVGQHLRRIRGIDFLERLARSECKSLVTTSALLCLPWSDTDRRRAEALGSRYFETPLRLDDLRNWLKSLE